LSLSELFPAERMVGEDNMMEMNEIRGVDSAVPGLAEISRSYMNDFIAEIKEILEKIEVELVDLEMEPDNADHLN